MHIYVNTNDNPKTLLSKSLNKIHSYAAYDKYVKE